MKYWQETMLCVFWDTYTFSSSRKECTINMGSKYLRFVSLMMQIDMPKKGTISIPEVHAEISQKQIISVSEVYVCMCHTDCNSSRCGCWHATETGHTSFRSVCWHSTEMNCSNLRSVWWHIQQKQTVTAPDVAAGMLQKQTIPVSEVYVYICHRNELQQLEKCMVTYATETDC